MNTPSSIVHRLLEDGWEPDPDQELRDEIINTPDPHKPSHKELMTLALRFTRRVQDKMNDPRSISALDVLARFIDGRASIKEMSGARHDATAAAYAAINANDAASAYAVYFAAAYATAAAAAADAAIYAADYVASAAYYARKASDDPVAERQAQQAIVDEMNVIFDLK